MLLTGLLIATEQKQYKNLPKQIIKDNTDVVKFQISYYKIKTLESPTCVERNIFFLKSRIICKIKYLESSICFSLHFADLYT